MDYCAYFVVQAGGEGVRVGVLGDEVSVFEDEPEVFECEMNVLKLKTRSTGKVGLGIWFIGSIPGDRRTEIWAQCRCRLGVDELVGIEEGGRFTVQFEDRCSHGWPHDARRKQRQGNSRRTFLV